MFYVTHCYTYSVLYLQLVWCITHPSTFARESWGADDPPPSRAEYLVSACCAWLNSQLYHPPFI